MNAPHIRTVAGISLVLPHPHGADPYADMENDLLADVVAALAPRMGNRKSGTLTFTGNPGNEHGWSPVVGWGVRAANPSDTVGSAPEAQVPLRSVRGPYTARRFEPDTPVSGAVFGDPLLAVRWTRPDLERLARVTSTEVLVAQRGADSQNDRFPAAWRVLDITGGTEDILRQIVGARLVVGDWLPAIAIAEAFGIDARLVATGPGERLDHRDYLAGTYRPVETIADSVAEAVELGAQTPPTVDIETLVRSFPRDLWTAARSVPDPEPSAGAVSSSPVNAESHLPTYTADRGADTADYARALASALALAEVPRSTATAVASELIEQRLWTYPHVRRAELREDLRSLDAVVCLGDADDLVEYLDRAQRGYCAHVHRAERRGDSMVVGLSLGVPDVVRRIEAVSVHRRGVEVIVPGYLLPARHLGRLDLDVVLPGEWDEAVRTDAVLTVTTHWVDGSETSVPLEVARAPRLFAGNPGAVEAPEAFADTAALEGRD